MGVCDAFREGAQAPGSGLENMPLSEVVSRSEGGLFNKAGQMLNHAMYSSTEHTSYATFPDFFRVKRVGQGQSHIKKDDIRIDENKKGGYRKVILPFFVLCCCYFVEMTR